MINIAVIIPFFQREPGILCRALQSILDQRIPPNTKIDIFVVDDGSPVSALDEVEELRFSPPFNLTLIRQNNRGVACARNAALKRLPSSIDYVAFLDSDDVWHERHLESGVGALESGFNFYFSNHRRDGFHESHFIEHCPELLHAPEVPAAGHHLRQVPKETLIASLIQSCPVQTSALIFRRRVAPDSFFPEDLKVAGEDVVFFIDLTKRSERCCANMDITVECGRGINIYFSRISWHGDNRLRILHDRIFSYIHISERMNLSPRNTELARRLTALLERDFVFFACRYVAKERRLPKEISSIAAAKTSFALWFAATALKVVTGWLVGVYRPLPG